LKGRLIVCENAKFYTRHTGICHQERCLEGAGVGRSGRTNRQVILSFLLIAYVFSDAMGCSAKSDKKLSCRRDRPMLRHSRHISLRHWRSFEMTYVTRIVSEILVENRDFSYPYIRRPRQEGPWPNVAIAFTIAKTKSGALGTVGDRKG